MRVVFVHGACVRDAAWWWHRAAAVLRGRVVASVAPILPSCGEAGTTAGSSGPGLADDVAAVRQTLEQTDEATVVVAHSYGGIVVAEAAADVPAVRHLLLISSYLPEAGESLGSFSGAAPAAFLDVNVEAGTLALRSEFLTETFLQDCPELAHEAILATSVASDVSDPSEKPDDSTIWTQVYVSTPGVQG